MAEEDESNPSLQELQVQPIPPLSSPSREFIDNRIDGEDHRAFRTTAVSPRSAALVEQVSSNPSISNALQNSQAMSASVIYQESDIHQRQFLDALEIFEKSLPEKYQTRFDIRGKHTWDEVIQEVQIAELKYKKKGSDEGAFSKVRGCFRKLESRAAGFETFLELIPSQNNYASPIAGSFKLIIRASTRMNEIRDFIFSALATIPEEVEKAQLLLDFNQDLDFSTRLHKRISELYISILNLIKQILQWLESRSGMRHLKALAQQGTYEKVLESKVTEFKRQVMLVKEEGE